MHYLYYLVVLLTQTAYHLCKDEPLSPSTKELLDRLLIQR